jgi:coproporphyrinogen III oxidase-like Fe-S oxidoreductase
MEFKVLNQENGLSMEDSTKAKQLKKNKKFRRTKKEEKVPYCYYYLKRFCKHSCLLCTCISMIISLAIVTVIVMALMTIILITLTSKVSAEKTLNIFITI